MARAYEPDCHDDAAADHERCGQPDLSEPEPIDNRTECVADEEERRMQRHGRAARGWRELGGIDLNDLVEHIEAEPEHDEVYDLRLPRQAQRHRDKRERRHTAAG